MVPVFHSLLLPNRTLDLLIQVMKLLEGNSTLVNTCHLHQDLWFPFHKKFLPNSFMLLEDCQSLQMEYILLLNSKLWRNRGQAYALLALLSLTYWLPLSADNKNQLGKVTKDKYFLRTDKYNLVYIDKVFPNLRKDKKILQDKEGKNSQQYYQHTHQENNLQVVSYCFWDKIFLFHILLEFLHHNSNQWGINQILKDLQLQSKHQKPTIEFSFMYN